MLTCAVALALLVARAVLPLSPPENESNPWKLIAAVPADVRARPVLNGYSMGGPLILAGIRPFIDGRGDMYGDRLVADYVRVAHGDPAAFAQTVRQWGICWAMLPHQSQLIPLLDRSAGWRRIASDPAGVVYVRTGA
jgi:hypothetical protein